MFSVCVYIHVHVYVQCVCVYTCTCSMYVSSSLKDPDYVFDLTEDNPEFKKLAFVAPGPKNAFALLKRSSRRCIQRKDEGIEYMNINDSNYDKNIHQI